MTEVGGRARRATVADVARRAGVAKATAARALGGYGAVSEDVRERVVAAAEELGYRPNELARSMGTGRSRTIGVVVGDIENDYFALAVRGISDTAASAGYDVVLVNTSEDVEAERKGVRLLLDKQVDGLIVSPASSADVDHLREVEQDERPLVLLDRRVPGLDAPSVDVDIATATRAATDLLLDRGHRRITYLTALDDPGGPWGRSTPLVSSSVADRLSGIVAALDARGVPVGPALVRFGARGDEAVRAAAEEVLRGRDAPTAVVASDGRIALGLLQALADLGVKVPRDLSLVMVDDFPWTRVVDPPLTAVRQPTYEVGAAAADTLVRLLSGAAPPRRAPLVAQLVVRSSVGAPRRRRAVL
ncbi:LacI family DNA-binding transcriptional regulator [Kineococcus esterisolvens]|uniref:LacI family DNA-binding transcriptional regulator n=1 Tax=unclassified Kineococcus TaxID=2621656 RepID=UPI003D7EE0A6